MHTVCERVFRSICTDSRFAALALAAGFWAGCSGDAGTPSEPAGAAVNGAAPAASAGQAAPMQVSQANQANMSMMTAAAGPGAMSTPGLATMAMAKTMMEIGTSGAAGAGAAGAGAQRPEMSAAGSGTAAAGSGAMTVAAAGSGGSAAPSTMTTAVNGCGEDAQLVMGTAPRDQGNGNTNLRTSGEVAFTHITGTMTVPMNPAPTRGTLFLWPGLQPLQMDQTVGYGVLQPVLSWGTSCADTSRTTYDQWWVSGVYVGTSPGSWTNISCHGGDSMDVEPGDKLDYEMKLDGTIWNQKVTNRTNGKSVTFPTISRVRNNSGSYIRLS